MCGHKCSQGVENKYSRRCRTMETQRLSRTRGNNRNLCFFSLGDNNFADKTAPVLGSKNGPQNGVHSLSLNLICLCPGDLAPVLGSVFGPQNGGRFVGKLLPPGEKKGKFRLFPRVRDRGFAYRWVSMVLQRREQLFATPCKHVCPHIFLNWGGPLWRDRFLLWFLDPKLAPRKITFFHPLKEQKVGKASEI